MQKIIDEILDNGIKNLHPSKREELQKYLIDRNDIKSKSRCWTVASKFLGLGGSTTSASQKYWLVRGWNEVEANHKSKHIAKEISKKGNHKSAYSVETWLEKMNPETGKNYTIEEAQYECDSRRPIRKEYWMNQGLSETDAIIKAADYKSENNKKGANVSKNRSVEVMKSESVKCVEYWILRGHSEIEAKKIISESQETFSLSKCILRFGEEEGTKIWKERQEKWQDTMTSKSDEEKAEIRSKQIDWIKTLNEVELKEHLQKISESSRAFWETKDTEDRIEHGKKIRETQVLNGKAMPLEELESQRRYNTLVDRYTRCQPIDTLANFDLRAPKNFHLDHKYSKLEGYKNKVDPSIIGHICNLEMIPWNENISKQSKCSITLETLLENIERYNDSNQNSDAS